jgi:hypothetical protein
LANLVKQTLGELTDSVKTRLRHTQRQQRAAASMKMPCEPRGCYAMTGAPVRLR